MSTGPSDTPPTGSSSQRNENEEAADGAGLVSLGRMVSDALDLLLLVVLTRVLEPATFALFAAVYLVQVTLSAIGPLGLPAALYYFVPKMGPGQERALGAWTTGILFVIAVPLSAVLWLADPWIASIADKPEAAGLFGLLAIYILGDFPAQALPNFVVARRAYRLSLLVNLAWSLSRVLSVAIPALSGASIDTVLWWYAAGALGRFAITVLYFTFFVPGQVRGDGWTLRGLLAFGAPLAGSNVVSRLNKELDKYFVLVVLSAAEFGVYVVGAQEIPLVPSIAYSVTSALLPTLVLRWEARDVTGFVQLWHGSMVKVATILVPVFFFCLVQAWPLMRILYGDAYQAAAVPFMVYLFLLPLRLCAYGGIVRSLGRTWPVLASALVALAVNAAVNYPALVTLGPAGPALASVLAQLAAIVFLLRIADQSLQLGWRRIFPYAGVARTVAVAAVAIVPVGLASAFLVEHDVLRVAVAAPLSVVAYLVIAWKAGLVSEADLLYLKRMISFRSSKASE